MQKILCTQLLLIFFIAASGQPTERFHYQITVRDSENQLLTDSPVGLRVRIIDMEDYTVLYQEQHTTRTGSSGIASINIGDGVNQSGDVSDMGDYVKDNMLYIRTDIDPMGGTNYKIVDHQRIGSFPKATVAGYVLEPPEKDPMFSASVAASIDQSSIGKWEAAARERHYPGDLAAGGVIYYVDHTGEEGLVVSDRDIFLDVPYQSTGILLPGTESLTDGKTNTSAAVAVAGSEAVAARMCDTLVMNGKDDWYLPALDELSLIYDARYAVNRSLGEDDDMETQGFADDRYWSSTTLGSGEAYLFDLGAALAQPKSSPAAVRAIRKFSGMYDIHNYSWYPLLGPEEELKSNGNVSEILMDQKGDVIIDQAGKRGTICRPTPEIPLPVKITFKLLTEYNPDASEPPTILRGTGDFRITFGGPPKGEYLGDIQESNMGEFEGVQFRIHPHLDESPIRVYTGSESHTCTSIWLRYVNPDKLTDDNGNPITGLASDECQGRGSQCGWERAGLFENGFGLENMEEALVTVILSEEIISISVKDRTWSVDIEDLMENDDDVVGDALRFDDVTFMSISHTNTSRGYRTIQISDLRVIPMQ